MAAHYFIPHPWDERDRRWPAQSSWPAQVDLDGSAVQSSPVSGTGHTPGRSV